jgi:RNA polymerase sigma-70 factor (ECF subfamily)
MLGSRADAEDAVQEAWLRLARQDAAAIDNLAGWLTTVVGRVCIDVLRSRKARPERSHDDRLPELIVTEDGGGAPEDDALLAESVGLALLVVLDTLRPTERLAFVLHDMFAVPFEEIGQIIGRSTDATKMLASRARRKVQDTHRPTDERQQQRAVVDAFLAAARDGDFAGLLQVLDPDQLDHGAGPDGVVVLAVAWFETLGDPSRGGQELQGGRDRAFGRLGDLDDLSEGLLGRVAHQEPADHPAGRGPARVAPWQVDRRVTRLERRFLIRRVVR